MTEHRHNHGAEKVSVRHLIEAVDYNAETGLFVWKKRPEHHFVGRDAAKAWNAKNAGKAAFKTKMGRGYLKGRFNGVDLLAHRVAWAITSGAFPEGDLDHINGDTADNRLKNLRPCSRSENLRNRGRTDSGTGVTGVYFHKASGLYHAKIQLYGRVTSLGYYRNLSDAARARRQAEDKHGFYDRLRSG